MLSFKSYLWISIITPIDCMLSNCDEGMHCIEKQISADKQKKYCSVTQKEKAVASGIIDNTVYNADLCVIETINIRIPVKCSCES